MKQLSRFLDDHCLLRVGGISHYITQDIQEAHDRHSYALYTGENIGSQTDSMQLQLSNIDVYDLSTASHAQSKNCLNSLNTRNKWAKGQHNLVMDSIVIIKEDNLRAMRCPIRKVIETHSGADKIIRTVTSGKVTTNTPNSALVLTSE